VRRVTEALLNAQAAAKRGRQDRAETLSRAAKQLHTHRNTLLRRIESAERLLPRPLENTSVRVAVALEALRLRGAKPDGPVRRPTGLTVSSG
jgi:hypothetical protein